VRELGWGLLMACVCVGAGMRAQGPAAIEPAGPAAGRVSGTVEDAQGALVPGAQVTLVVDGSSREMTSGSDGRFAFDGVPAGAFTVKAKEDGMVDGECSGMLGDQQQMELDPMLLKVGATEEVTAVTQEQMATIEVRKEEQQRIGGILPNYYVVYDANAQPLTAKLKWQLGWKSVVDPANVAFVGAVAGLEQANNSFAGYRQGAQGYGKRFGAGMADATVGTLLTGSLLPVIFKQDPRYFYRGTGSVPRRAWYALRTAVIAKGDNGRWQPAYANVLGSFGAGAVSNLYYPPGNRGSMLVLENGLSALAFDGFSNVMQEFVLRRMTPRRADPELMGE
jgi:hypothetical protein